jgi:hypothetical protein
MSTVPDGGDERDGRRRVWEAVGRELLCGELSDHRIALEDAFRDAEEGLYGTYNGGEYSGDLTPEHITAMRRALNEARWFLEEVAAPAAGCESWGDPQPDIPAGVLWDWTDHPRADGVDPREYVDDEDEES